MGEYPGERYGGADRENLACARRGGPPAVGMAWLAGLCGIAGCGVQGVDDAGVFGGDGGPEIANAELGVSLPAKLCLLFKCRDVVAHSYAGHVDRYWRLRRVRGRNEIVLVTQQKIAEEWQRGIECRAGLRFILVCLPGLAGRPDSGSL